jgi:hypothetical protein
LGSYPIGTFRKTDFDVTCEFAARHCTYAEAVGRSISTGEEGESTRSCQGMMRGDAFLSAHDLMSAISITEPLLVLLSGGWTLGNAPRRGHHPGSPQLASQGGDETGLGRRPLERE